MENISIEVYTRTNDWGVKKRILDILSVELGLDVDMYTWPNKIENVNSENIKKDDFIKRNLKKYHEFKEWADTNNVKIHPPFRKEEYQNPFGEGTSKEIRFPITCIAVYNEGKLTTVAPHKDQIGTYTIDDLLSTLKSTKSIQSKNTFRK